MGGAGLGFRWLEAKLRVCLCLVSIVRLLEFGSLSLFLRFFFISCAQQASLSKNFRLQAEFIPQFILPAENALGSDFLEILVFLFKKIREFYRNRWEFFFCLVLVRFGRRRLLFGRLTFFRNLDGASRKSRGGVTEVYGSFGALSRK